MNRAGITGPEQTRMQYARKKSRTADIAERHVTGSFLYSSRPDGVEE